MKKNTFNLYIQLTLILDLQKCECACHYRHSVNVLMKKPTVNESKDQLILKSPY